MPVPTNHSKPVRTSAKESAYSQLEQWIIDGTLQPGEKLTDIELAQALNLSRTPIREALQLLEMVGFVRMYPGKATTVTEVLKEDINHLLPPLAVLQALAGELAVPNITEDQIRRLEETNQRFAKAIEAKDSFTALKIDEEFHRIIIEAAQNPYITIMLSRLQSHVRRQFFHHSLELSEASRNEHDQIIQAFKDKDAERLSSLTKNNWIRSIEEMNAK
ncbi:GntR family transcriptional regulator [Planomicrobium okeanokoites]|uniref:GntR family transcriptional regulator n=1 Tax=Planomicrobium okeanokoites TaxID=244 RepID=A0ABV7KJW5_PLAOK|nr:GntR family transcriptional regulator [Planomicrobium okeanokoites]TAA69123.1 GntR family transcriptional regulator [Planomicrobium okeanokoites]